MKATTNPTVISIIQTSINIHINNNNLYKYYKLGTVNIYK